MPYYNYTPIGSRQGNPAFSVQAGITSAAVCNVTTTGLLMTPASTTPIGWDPNGYIASPPSWSISNPTVASGRSITYTFSITWDSGTGSSDVTIKLKNALGTDASSANGTGATGTISTSYNWPSGAASPTGEDALVIVTGAAVTVQPSINTYIKWEYY